MIVTAESLYFEWKLICIIRDPVGLQDGKAEEKKKLDLKQKEKTKRVTMGWDQ